MTLADIIVVYLSCGAPFGVLVFLSKRSALMRTVAEGVLATMFWPVLALSWTHRRLLLKRTQTPRPKPMGDRFGPASREPHLSEYETLTRALADSKRDSKAPTSELFEIAGHSNPRLAAVCSERRRNDLLARRQRASADAVIEYLSRDTATTEERLFEFGAYCRGLDDPGTAERIEQIAKRRASGNFEELIGPVVEPERIAA